MEFLGILIIFLALVLIQTESVYKEQKRHNRVLENISREQTKFLESLVILKEIEGLEKMLKNDVSK